MNDSELSFSLKSLEKRVRENSINLDYIRRTLFCRDAIGRLRYKDNIGEPWGFWDKFIYIFERSAENAVIFEEVPRENFVLVNYSYFLPSLFRRDLNEVKHLILCMSYIDTVIVLNSKENFKIILELFLNLRLGDINLSPGFLFALLHAYYVNLDFSNEASSVFIRKVKIFLETTNASANLKKFVNDLIESVEKKLVKSLDFKESKAKKNIALFLCGQVRGDVTAALNNYRKAFFGMNVDLFVSTWRKKGETTIRSQQLYRVMSARAVKNIEDNFSSVSENFINYLNNYLRSKNTSINEQLFAEKYFSENDCFNDIYINVENDENRAFSVMSNPEKMYYHNSVWINKLGDEFFRKYDLCVKLRPDARINSLNLDEIFEVTEEGVITEDPEGRFLRVWGFGIGDQAVFSNALNFVDLMKSWNDKQISGIFEELNLKKYIGHANIGNVAMKRGMNIIGNKFFNISLDGAEKISDDEINGLIADYKRNF